MDDVWGSIKSIVCKVTEYQDPIAAEVALGYAAFEPVLRSYFKNHKDCDGSFHNQRCLDELENRVAKLGQGFSELKKSYESSSSSSSLSTSPPPL
ncbi:hypothetical protein CDL15_Pgr023507 [Punica granatum]|uniref:Uncharacterized protein n=1 Tax=Punica granatum TaxID=22663 RepID=A0A218W8Y8_PUNGR|nr:hypothetical protein CDL15_Pgr023507 [Punica granatum]PKI42792.1 hypothetical protein CRG98_036808 [Punica granatum]